MPARSRAPRNLTRPSTVCRGRAMRHRLIGRYPEQTEKPAYDKFADLAGDRSDSWHYALMLPQRPLLASAVEAKAELARVHHVAQPQRGKNVGSENSNRFGPVESRKLECVPLRIRSQEHFVTECTGPQ